MNRKFITLLLAVLPLTTAACTPPHNQKITMNDKATLKQSQSSGYIVTALKEGEPAIRLTYTKFGIVAIKLIGNGQYELHVRNDPGLHEMANLATHSGGAIKSIQPNYIYKAF